MGPAILYRGNLVSALRWLGRWFETQFRLSVDVAGGENVDAKEEIRVALFRAARELLFNVVKHARVPGARIDVSRSPDGRVQVVVRDNGVGFDPESAMAENGTEGKLRPAERARSTSSFSGGNSTSTAHRAAARQSRSSGRRLGRRSPEDRGASGPVH